MMVFLVDLWPYSFFDTNTSSEGIVFIAWLVARAAKPHTYSGLSYPILPVSPIIFTDWRIVLSCLAETHSLLFKL